MMHPVATTGSRNFPMRAITASRAEHMQIGELSRLSGVNVETIRYYERIKMLPSPRRSGSGRRVYAASELRMLAFIRRARELGFSLHEIRALLRLGAPGMASCNSALRSKLASERWVFGIDRRLSACPGKTA